MLLLGGLEGTTTTFFIPSIEGRENRVGKKEGGRNKNKKNLWCYGCCAHTSITPLIFFGYFVFLVLGEVGHGGNGGGGERGERKGREKGKGKKGQNGKLNGLCE